MLQRVEAFFWDFCDNYLELAKSRRYGDFGDKGAESANSAMLLALSSLNRLFAPFLPFVAEEVWSWWQAGSVHAAQWPDSEDIAAVIPGHGVDASSQYLRVSEVLGEIRKRKAEARFSPATPLARVHIHNNESFDRAWSPDVLADLKSAARTTELVFITDTAFNVEIVPQQERAE